MFASQASYRRGSKNREFRGSTAAVTAQTEQIQRASKEAAIKRKIVSVWNGLKAEIFVCWHQAMLMGRKDRQKEELKRKKALLPPPAQITARMTCSSTLLQDLLDPLSVDMPGTCFAGSNARYVGPKGDGPPIVGMATFDDEDSPTVKLLPWGKPYTADRGVPNPGFGSTQPFFASLGTQAA